MVKFFKAMSQRYLDSLIDLHAYKAMSEQALKEN